MDLRDFKLNIKSISTKIKDIVLKTGIFITSSKLSTVNLQGLIGSCLPNLIYLNKILKESHNCWSSGFKKNKPDQFVTHTGRTIRTNSFRTSYNSSALDHAKITIYFVCIILFSRTPFYGLSNTYGNEKHTILAPC